MAFLGKPFEDYLLPAEPGGCVLFSGAKNSFGYGVYRGKLTHRRAYEKAYGPIPGGLIIMHSCDNPPCCNPDHLRAGTHADNVADKVAKGRQSRAGMPPKSSRKWLAPFEVEFVRAALDLGHSVAEVAQMFDVLERRVRLIQKTKLPKTN